MVVLEAKAIKDLRLKEDLAELNQKYFNDKYLKFLTYNDQNTRTAEIKAKNLERDPQVLNKLFIEGQVEEQFAKESYLHMKAYKEEQERLKAIDEASCIGGYAVLLPYLGAVALWLSAQQRRRD